MFVCTVAQWLADVIIPAFNEEKSIEFVINDIPKKLIREVIVVDNNSTDATGLAASKAGATVLKEKVQGYGAACLQGIDYLKNKIDPPNQVVFLDADYSDYPEQIQEIYDLMIHKSIDFVIGSRELGKREKGSMTIPQIFGNWLATNLLKIIYGVKNSDLGPFRGIDFNKLLNLKMEDKNYGWTMEMQVKAAKQNLTYAEFPANYRQRIGVSKVSGTIKGTILAGYKIITTLFKYI